MHRTPAILAALALAFAGCGGAGGDDIAAEAVAGYADGVRAAYTASLASATAMDESIDAFLADPSDDTMAAARESWLAARDDYGPTEAFRFYGGPIDAEDDGVEGLVNAWPLDEAYIDGVDGDPDSGIVHDVEGTPEITADVLLAANEMGGETNVATGWHAIEFLLWGQDLSADGPGDRPVDDYVDAPDADRRGTYLGVASDLLLTHLQGLVDDWEPEGAETYREEFLSLDTDEALTMVLTGIGELSRGELAGERMSVAFFDRSQEDEHSCFSDNTTADVVANAEGIRWVIEGDYPGLQVTGIDDVVQATDEDLAAALTAGAAASVEATEAIPAPFDQHLVADLGDDDPGRASILTAIEQLEAQTDTIVAAATALDLTLVVS